MSPKLLETPEEFLAEVEREFRGRYQVSLKPSYEKGIEAILWIEAPRSQVDFVQARAADLCAAFHDATRKLIVPMTVATDDEDFPLL